MTHEHTQQFRFICRNCHKTRTGFKNYFLLVQAVKINPSLDRVMCMRVAAKVNSIWMGFVGE